MRHRRTLLSLSTGIALFALAASPFAAASYGGDEGACGCGACAMAGEDLTVLLNDYLQAKVPETFCADMPSERVALAKAMPVSFYSQLLSYHRRDEIPAFFELASERFCAPETTTVDRTHLLDLLAFFPYQANSGRLNVWWKADSKSFQTNHLLSFASAGPEAMAVELKQRAKKDVAPAAWLAMHGDDSGAKLLRKSLKETSIGATAVCDESGCGAACEANGCIDRRANAVLAAFALAHLGDQEALPAVRKSLEEASLAALDAGDLARARALALETEFFCKKLVQAGDKAEIAWLPARAVMYVRENAARVQDAEGVFRVIEGLRS